MNWYSCQEEEPWNTWEIPLIDATQFSKFSTLQCHRTCTGISSLPPSHWASNRRQLIWGILSFHHYQKCTEEMTTMTTAICIQSAKTWDRRVALAMQWTNTWRHYPHYHGLAGAWESYEHPTQCPRTSWSRLEQAEAQWLGHMAMNSMSSHNRRGEQCYCQAHPPPSSEGFILSHISSSS